MSINQIEKGEYEKVAMYNLRELSPHHNLSLNLNTIYGWFRENPDKELQDLEKELRAEDLDIYLIVNKNFSNERFKIVNMKNVSEPADYLLVVSCRIKEEALKELHEHHDSYEDNFALLNKAGSLMEKTTIVGPNFEEETYQTFSDKPIAERTAYDILKYNISKIKVVIKEFDDIFALDVKRAEDAGLEVEHKLIGLDPTGGPIMGAFYQNKLVSKIGFTVYYENDEKKIKFFDLDFKH